MFKVAFFAPIAEGKTEQARQFAKDWSGARKQEHEESRRRFGMSVESTWLQQTPQGNFLVIYTESENREKMHEGFSKSQEPYDVWFRQQISEIFGFDMAGEEDDGPNENLLDWQDGSDTSGTVRYGFFAPILPGKLDAWKQMVASMRGDQAAGQAESRRLLGVKSERAWLQNTPMGDFVVVVLQVKNPEQFFKGAGESNAAFDKWFAEQVKEIHGMDITKDAPPPNETLVDWHAMPVTAG